MPSLTQELLVRLLDHKGGVPHVDLQTRSVAWWKWPLDPEGNRVQCYRLVEGYRAKWDCANPYCICTIGTKCNTEAAIYRAVKGIYAGEYVAGCALDRCGYLERISVLVEIAMGSYRARCGLIAVPAPVLFMDPLSNWLNGHYSASYIPRLKDEEEYLLWREVVNPHKKRKM
ncbi:hypothetical protein HWV62_2756, partial [Athelia sp. TMB]